MINVTYIRHVLRILHIETEVKEMFQALKNVMLCLSYMKFATLRAKAMKIIKKLIKLSPEILHDKDIMKILSLRLMDVSSSTRESTLDLLWYCLTKVDFDTEEKQLTFQKDFINKYLSIIVERADDSNLGVRKKVVQILAFIL